MKHYSIHQNQKNEISYSLRLYSGGKSSYLCHKDYIPASFDKKGQEWLTEQRREKEIEYIMNLLDILEEEDGYTFADVYVLLRNQVMCNYAKKLVEQDSTQNDDFNQKLNIVSLIRMLIE